MRILIILSVIFLSACTSELKIFSGPDGKEVKGVPFRGSEVWVAEGYLTTHSKGAQCTPSPFQEYVTLASGKLYYAKPEPGPLADSEFSISFNDSGSVKQVQLNSESNFAENVSAVSELAGTVLPFISAPKAPAEIAAAPAIACDTGKDVRSFVRLDEWSPDTWKPN